MSLISEKLNLLLLINLKHFTLWILRKMSKIITWVYPWLGNIRENISFIQTCSSLVLVFFCHLNELWTLIYFAMIKQEGWKKSLSSPEGWSSYRVICCLLIYGRRHNFALTHLLLLKLSIEFHLTFHPYLQSLTSEL